MIRFEWDEQKASSNLRKHGISFNEATKIFDDPYAIIEMDIVERGERRWRTIGRLDGTLVILFVAHSSDDFDDGEVIRIISARRAVRKEIEAYGKNCES